MTIKNENKVFLISSIVLFLLSILAIIFQILKIEISYNNIQLYTSFKITGAVTAIILSYFLSENINILNMNSIYLKWGFLFSGSLLIVHSLLNVGDAFVYTYIFSNLIAGMGFFLTSIFIKEKNNQQQTKMKIISTSVFGTILLTLGVFILLHDSMPKTITNGKFSLIVIILSLIIGATYLWSARYFFKRLGTEKYKIIKNFILVLILFGFSSMNLMFSEIWSLPWWIWNFIRLAANILLIRTIFLAYEDAMSKIEEKNKEMIVINKKLENYSYTISHDLKEPIRSIRSFSGFILEDFADVLNDEGKDYLNRVIRASNRMALMIDDLLILSRIGKRDAIFESVNISSLLAEVIYSISERIKESQTEIVYSEMPTIVCQPVWIKVLFSNLILNSIKYQNKKESHPIIEIGYKEKDTAYEFFVKDNGKGIETDQFEKIFGLFRRGTAEKNIEGSGAGLAIVQSIVEEHNGKVWVYKSGIDVGTIIKFTIEKRRL